MIVARPSTSLIVASADEGSVSSSTLIANPFAKEASVAFSVLLKVATGGAKTTAHEAVAHCFAKSSAVSIMRSRLPFTATIGQSE